MAIPYPCPRTFVYKVDDSGHQVSCDVYIPDDITKPCPVIMWMHHGGLVCENRHSAGTHVFFSGPKRGYIVVNLDYRLAPQAQIGDIYADVEDCAHWVRTVLPTLLPGNIVDQSRLVIGGGSCGGQLALTTGLYLKPPPQAIIALYAVSDPTDPAMIKGTKPYPPPGRDRLISHSEVANYLDANSASVSHPENALDLPKKEYHGRASAYFYMLQEGTYLPSVYGSQTVADVYAKWAIPPNISTSFPPCFISHGIEDQYTPVKQSQDLVNALAAKGVAHCWYPVLDHDHCYDVYDMNAGEQGELDKAFAATLWPWLDTLVA